LRPGERPISVDPKEQIERNMIRNFGLEHKIFPSGTKQSHAPREYSYRKIFEPFGTTRAQIVAWLSDLNILHINDPIEEWVCRTELVTLEPDNTEFEKQRADKIAGLQVKIAEAEADLADLHANWKTNGHASRDNTTLKKRFVKAIDEARKEVTQTKRAKPPETEPKRVEVDIPNSEYLRLRFVGRTLHEEWVSGYLKSYDADGFPLASRDAQVNDETFRVFENAVIFQAFAKRVLVIDPDVLAMLTRKYPGLLNPGQEQALSDRQADFYAEYDSHASGLRFRGRGMKVTGAKYVGKALETFDGVFKTNRGPGSGGDGGHPGAPDYDPSDDTND
jgi:hypothetical protein